MKPYEEIDFPNGFLRWIREDGVYGCTLTEEQMIKIKALHEAPRTWVGLTDGEVDKMILLMGFPPDWITENAIVKNIVRNLEAKLKEKNS